MNATDDGEGTYRRLDMKDDRRLEILGVPLDLLSREAVRAEVGELLRQSPAGQCRHLVTLNPEYVMRARRDETFARSLRSADVVTADGIGVLLAARLLAGKRAARLGRVTGVEIVEWLAADSGMAAAPLFLLGAAAGAAADASGALQRDLPECRVAGWWGEGSASPNDDAVTIERIAKSGARVVLVAYGAPGQVLWIERNRDALGRAGVRLAVGVGGALDFLAGRVPRAPRVVQRIGLEWLYRLLREPWRWRRQVVLPVFAILVLRDAVRVRVFRRSPTRSS